MFILNPNTCDIDMHIGDTGSFTVHAVRASGTPWATSGTNLAYMEFTVMQKSGAILLQRYYKVPVSGDIEITFENEDTDKWLPGKYLMERRYIINPVWTDRSSGSGTTAPSGDIINALESSAVISDGDVVRTPENGQPLLILKRIYGEV